MMIRYRELKKKPAVFRSMTGLSLKGFGALLPAFYQAYEDDLDRRDAQRLGSGAAAMPARLHTIIAPFLENRAPYPQRRSRCRLQPVLGCFLDLLFIFVVSMKLDISVISTLRGPNLCLVISESRDGYQASFCSKLARFFRQVYQTKLYR